jgi:ABC-type glycerol-3-phosphate transport system permease component
MVPFEVLIVPLFIVIVRIHWVNTYQGIILPMAAGPLGIFIMRQFLLSMPGELLDAARIDGSSEFGIFWRIVLPLSRPALAALSTLIFLAGWNAFLWPLIATTKESLRVLPLAIALLQLEFTGVYGMMMAMATLTFAPPLIIFVAFQRYFVQGITLSGIKG